MYINYNITIINIKFNLYIVIIIYKLNLLYNTILIHFDEFNKIVWLFMFYYIQFDLI